MNFLDSTTELSPAPDEDTTLEDRADRRRRLGSSIRTLRRQLDLSTSDLADRAGVSTSMVSQVERGVTAPSLDVLWAIARALDVPMGTFFQENPATLNQDHAAPRRIDEPVVVRKHNRKRLGLTDSLTYELLTPDLQHRIEFVWIEFGPGEEGPVEPFVHEGEEQMVVISGEMRIWVDEEEFVLYEGDAITIDSSRPHRAGNRSDRPATVIAAITPPSF